MARASQKNNRRILNHRENVLFKKWNSTISLVDDYIIDVTDGLFRMLKRVMGDDIYIKSMSDSRLSAYDEKIYEHYNKLMDGYKEIIQINKSNPSAFSDEHTQKIYDGLYEIISFRLKNFEEKLMIEVDDRSLENDFSNPIVSEKNYIIMHCMDDFRKEFDKVHYDFKTNNQNDIVMTNRQKLYENLEEDVAINVIDEICMQLKQECATTFFDLYISSIKKTITKLNNFEERKVVSYYFDILSEEYEILSTIIKVQSKALEDATKDLQDDDDAVLNLEKILKILRGLYQEYSKETSNILNLNRESQNKNNQESIDDIEKYLQNDFIEQIFSFVNGMTFLEISDFDILKEQLAGHCDLLQESFERETEIIFKNISRKNSMLKKYDEIKKMFSKAGIMAKDMISVFESIYLYYNDNKESLLSDSQSKEILMGVAETIEIKIESIKENAEIFEVQSKKSIEEVLKTKVEINIEDIKKTAVDCYNRVTQILLNYGKDNKKVISLIKKELNQIYGSDLAQRYETKIEKTMIKKIEESKKQVIRFMRDYLMFEMMTFEEIKTYSVSKLREESCESVIDFVKLIDEKSLELSEILLENEVFTINPASHEMFNGKEHEALIAENNEEYKKGEIIKVMNSGYKYKDIVILRANVIAAK